MLVGRLRAIGVHKTDVARVYAQEKFIVIFKDEGYFVSTVCFDNFTITRFRCIGISLVPD